MTDEHTEGYSRHRCNLCGFERHRQRIVYQDGGWYAGVGPRVAVPGWLTFWTERHTIGLWSMTPNEALALGQLIHKLSAVLREVGGAERVYITSYAETFEHLHGVLITRGKDIPIDLRGPALLPREVELRDEPGALRLAAKLREGLDRAALVQ